MKDFIDLIEAEANRLGFNLFGITQAIQPPHYDQYRKWVTDKYFGEMKYLTSAHNIKIRENPDLLFPGNKMIISVGSIYPSIVINHDKGKSGLQGRIASFAQGQDYHQKIIKNLKQLSQFIQNKSQKPIKNKSFCDTGPILEKEFGEMAGLGWIGKNSLLISPIFGSFMNLGEIILEIESNQPSFRIHDQCGDCRTCIDNCPTGCIKDNHTLEADRCISYLTIEHKGIIERSLRPKMGNWIYGCDICQIVCPWNQKHLFRPDSLHNHKEINLIQEIQINEKDYYQKYRNSTIKHIKWAIYRRNIIIALGNHKESVAVDPLTEILLFEKDPLIRQYSAWALGQIGNKTAKDALGLAHKRENNVQVRNEIEIAFA